MNSSKFITDTKSLVQITKLGMVINIGLSIFKLLTGLFIGSLALIADGVHSLSDIATDVAVLVGTILGSQPPDAKHPFGHGKIETLSGSTVAVALIATGGWIVYEAITSTKPPVLMSDTKWIIIMGGVAVGIKEWLFHATNKVAKECKSDAMMAHAWDHRSDALTSLIVVLGGIVTMSGWPKGDRIAGLIVGIIVVIVGIKIILKTIDEFIEGAADSDVLEDIRGILNNHPDVHDWHRLRTRRSGRILHIDVHIVLDANLSLIQANNIVHLIENEIKQKLTWTVNCMIHADPDIDEIREIVPGESRKKELEN